MKRIFLRACACLTFACTAAAVAQTPSGTLFHSGFEPVFNISGKVGYPAPAANALIEAHVAGRVSTTRSGADGRYTVAIERRYLPAAGIVELVAFDRANPARVWAGALGPASRLLALGGAAAGIDASHDPFVNLGPYSTAVAAMLRGYNGFAPIADAATFERAARTITPHAVLVYGLALVARGDLALPAGAANTFDAVLSAPAARALYASVADAGSDPCTSAAVSAYCAVALGLPRDPDIVPAVPVATGVVHVPYLGYQSSLDWSALAYRIDGATGTVWYDGLTAQAVDVTDDDATTGTRRLARADGQPIARLESFDFVAPVGQVRTWYDTTAVLVRATPGPGGAPWQSNAFRTRVSYPDNPELPPRDEHLLFPLPTNAAGGAPTANALASLPNLAGAAWVLPLPSDLGVPPDSDPFNQRFGYDVHASGASTGTAQRSALAYTWSTTGNGRVTFAYGATSATLDFVNEEEPGVWRVVTRMQASGYDLFLVGLALPVQASTGWSAASPPGTYVVEINGYSCAGPYGELSEGACSTSPMTFRPDGVVDRFGIVDWGTWTYAAAPHDGKLRFERATGLPPFVEQRRGWERVRWSGGKGYILENVNPSAPGVPAAPVTFGPTARLSRLAQ